MDDPSRQRWISIAILVGLLYPAIAVASSELAAAVASSQMQFFWRLSAFVISGVVLAAHIAYEYFRLRNTMWPTAWHAALAVALGAFVLALMANIHDLVSASGYRSRMLIALVAWPILTAVPAFIVALVVAAVLQKLGVQVSTENQPASRPGAAPQ
jgi:nitrate reductase NapE component